MEITIQELHKKDISKAIDFAIVGMHFEKYADQNWVVRLYGRYFLYLEMQRATQIIAAYHEEKLVGILMADMKDERKKYTSFWKGAYIKMVEIGMAFVAKEGANSYDTTNQEMYQAFAQANNPHGEICFLATDPTLQGAGVGSKLLEALSEREQGKQVYLYTDDNCTYQFYERRGFTRAGEKQIEMKLGEKTVPLTCLLYSKIL